MRAAKLAGITHVYAEVAITPYGFYARDTLNRLLPAAHKQGIAVIAWVYPYLRDVSLDVRLTKLVADYVTPGGERADGIATDIEEVIDRASVYSYGQLTRALLGHDTLMVAAVFHPFAKPRYPYDAIAASWNVLAPMNYWHSHASKLYGRADVTRFVATSIITIRAAMGLNQLLSRSWARRTTCSPTTSLAATQRRDADEMIADMDTAQGLRLHRRLILRVADRHAAEWDGHHRLRLVAAHIPPHMPPLTSKRLCGLNTPASASSLASCVRILCP